MTYRFLIGIFVAMLASFADCETEATAVASSAEMKTQVFRYLDSADAEDAANILKSMLSDPQATIDQAIRIIQTDRNHSRRANRCAGGSLRFGTLHSPDLSDS